MAIRLICPSGHSLTVSDKAAGQRVQCPHCGKEAVVPPPSEPEGSQAGIREETGPSPPGLELPAEGISGITVLSTTEWAVEGEGVTTGPAGPSGSGQAAETPVRPSSPPPLWGRTVPGPGEPRPWQGPPAPRPKMMAADTYRLDRGKLQTVRLLALLLIGVAFLNVLPVGWLGEFDLEQAPGWARVAALLAVIQLVYVLWMVTTPDWSSVWVVTTVLAVVAALYAMATGIVLATPLDRPMPLGLGEYRRGAPRWCGAVLLFTLLATYLCGRIAARWRRSFELEMAGRDKPHR